MIFVVAFLVLSVLVVGMSIGVIMGKKPLKGSCGGVGAALKEKDYVCELCGGDEKKCEEEQAKNLASAKQSSPQSSPADLAYNADQSSKEP